MSRNYDADFVCPCGHPVLKHAGNDTFGCRAMLVEVRDFCDCSRSTYRAAFDAGRQSVVADLHQSVMAAVADLGR